MAVTTAQHTDVSQALARLLADVEGLRVEWTVADKTRPPVAVIGLPSIVWNDPDSAFCWALWDFPITVITARNNDRDAQAELSRLVRDIAVALSGPTPPGVFDIQLIDARPTTAVVAGAELPAYVVRTQIRA